MIETAIQAYVQADEAWVNEDLRMFKRCIDLAHDWLFWSGYEGKLYI